MRTPLLTPLLPLFPLRLPFLPSAQWGPCTLSGTTTCSYSTVSINIQPVYNALFKRNSIFITSVFLAAFTFSIGFDLATSAFWDRHNRGVSAFSASVTFSSLRYAVKLHEVDERGSTQADGISQKQWKDIRDKYLHKDEE